MMAFPVLRSQKTSFPTFRRN